MMLSSTVPHSMQQVYGCSLALSVQHIHMLCRPDGILWCYWLCTYNILAPKSYMDNSQETQEDQFRLLVQHVQHCPLCDSHVPGCHWIHVLDSTKCFWLQVLPMMPNVLACGAACIAVVHLECIAEECPVVLSVCGMVQASLFAGYSSRSEVWYGQFLSCLVSACSSALG